MLFRLSFWSSNPKKFIFRDLNHTHDLLQSGWVGVFFCTKERRGAAQKLSRAALIITAQPYIFWNLGHPYYRTAKSAKRISLFCTKSCLRLIWKWVADIWPQIYSYTFPTQFTAQNRCLPQNFTYEVTTKKFREKPWPHMFWLQNMRETAPRCENGHNIFPRIGFQTNSYTFPFLGMFEVPIWHWWHSY